MIVVIIYDTPPLIMLNILNSIISNNIILGILYGWYYRYNRTFI